MKWIGQHIWDFISRFRSKVYLEDVANAGSDTDAFLVKKADGEIAIRTGAEVLSDIGGSSTTGDMTGVDITVGTGLDISQSNTTGGDYTSTINLDLTEVGVNGSANQLLTDDGDGTVTSESYLTFANSGNISRMEFLSDQDTGDKCRISTTTHGATTIDTIDDDANAAHLTLQSDGDIRLSPATNKIWEIFDFHTTTFENTYSSGHHGGKVLRHSNGTSDLTLGQIYYLRSNGYWVHAYADDDDSGGPGCGDFQMLGVGLGNPQSVGVLIEGFVRIPYTEILNNPGSGNVDGLPLYVSAGTAGHFDFNAPSDSGDFVRIVGYAIDDYDTGSGNMDVLVYFNPSKTYIEIA